MAWRLKSLTAVHAAAITEHALGATPRHVWRDYGAMCGVVVAIGIIGSNSLSTIALASFARPAYLPRT